MGEREKEESESSFFQTSLSLSLKKKEGSGRLSFLSPSFLPASLVGVVADEIRNG